MVGLLVTDGNLSKDGRHIIMRSSDRELLQIFKDYLSLTNIIAISNNDGYAKKPCYRLQFSDVIFYRWLKTIGLFPAKTYTIGKIKIPDIYFRDFLRGHLDGDGTILLYKDTYNFYRGRQYINQRIYVKFISASEKHILWLSEKVQELLKVKGSLSCTKHPKDEKKVPIWVLKFSKKESINLLHLIYYSPSLPCLQRKLMLAQAALTLVNNQKRKTYTKFPSSLPISNSF